MRSPLFPERLLSRSHLRSEMNLLLPVGWVWTANEREICSYREKVSHAPGLKNQPWVTMEGGKKPTLSAALAGNDCWHPVWQSQNDVLFLLNKRRKKNYSDWCFSQLITNIKGGKKHRLNWLGCPGKSLQGTFSPPKHNIHIFQISNTNKILFGETCSFIIAQRFSVVLKHFIFTFKCWIEIGLLNMVIVSIFFNI